MIRTLQDLISALRSLARLGDQIDGLRRELRDVRFELRENTNENRALQDQMRADNTSALRALTEELRRQGGRTA